MDGISSLDAIYIYSMLFSPLISIVLLLFWTSANMKNTSKIQLLGIVILLALGLLAINSPLILVIEATAIILLVVWLNANRNYFLKDQLSVILSIFALQIAYYMLFPTFIGLLPNLTITLLGIPILSMILLYPWTFGNKKKSKGRIFIIIVFIVQIIFVILNLVLSLMVMSII